MKHISKLSFIVVILLLFSCSKSDNTAVVPISVTGGAIFRSQVVTVALPDTNLTENEYQATLDGITLKLTKSEDNKLFFFVPLATTIGIHNLVIPSLNNTTIGYDVKDMVLSETPEATITGLTSNLSTFSQTLDTSPESVNIQNSIINFNTVFSNASVADKTQMAIFYKANKTLFDAMILNDYSNVGGRRSTSDIESEPALLAKFKISMFFMAAGGVITDIPVPNIQAIGILVAGVAMAKSLEYGKKLINLNLNTSTITADGVDGVNNRNAQGTIISLQDNVARTINFNTKNKQLLTSDATNGHSEVALLFKFYNIYNAFVDKANVAIQFVNAHVILCNFSLLPLLQIPTTSATVNNAVNANTFGYMTFSINNPNLSLITATLQSDGQLNIKVKVNGTPTTTPVLSDLNYIYNDAFSSFKGNLPISVDAVLPCEDNITSYPIVTIGSQVWMQKNLNVCKYRNGDDIPQVTDPAEWANLTTGAWCYFNNDTANGPVYGKLYNWYAVNDSRGLAPEGYHIPNEDEWTALTTFLGGEYIAGGKMKATTLWLSPNYGATNSSGFTGLPSGSRNVNGDGMFGPFGGYVNWWSVLDYNTSSESSAFDHNLSTNNGSCYHYLHNKKVGFSVRCLRD